MLCTSVQTTERELAKTLLYTQTATRRAQGINVESVPPTSVQSTAEQASTLNVQQKMKQFDAVRREQQQEQVEVQPFITRVSWFNVFVMTEHCTHCNTLRMCKNSRGQHFQTSDNDVAVSP